VNLVRGSAGDHSLSKPQRRFIPTALAAVVHPALIVTLGNISSGNSAYFGLAFLRTLWHCMMVLATGITGHGLFELE
jgi:hypothetical protein